MTGHTDLLIDRARELLALDDSWHWCKLEMVGPKRTAVKIELGQKKGEKFVRPFHSIHLSVCEAEANALAWEQRTGKCCACMGTGQEFAAWSVTEGTTYRPCGRCKGSKEATP